MLKIMKYMKPYIGIVAIILALLFVQAISDLSLPDYMSKIVNVGIQQKGIENAVPEAIRAKELDKVKLFLSDKEKKLVDENYIKLDKNQLTSAKYKEYLKDYSILKKEPVYKLDTKDQKTIDKLDTILGKAELTTMMIEKNGLQGPKGSSNKAPANGTTQQAPATQQIPKDADPFVVLSQLPKEQFDQIKADIDKSLKKMEASMVTQSAIPYVKDEYKAIGIDVDALQRNYIFFAGAKMIGIAFISMGAAVAVAFLAAKVATGLSRTLRRNVFRKIGDFSNVEFDKFSTSSLITRTTNDIQQVQMIVGMSFSFLVYAPILGVGGVLKVLKTDVSMVWIIGVAVAAVLAVVGVLFTLAFPRFKKLQKLVDKLNLVMRESLTGMLVIRAFNTQKKEEKKFNDVNEEYTRTNLFLTRLMTMMMPMIMLIMNAITILIIWVGAHQVDAGTMQVGDMMAFIQYAMQIIFSFIMISLVSTILPRASVSAGRIAEVLETTPAIQDPEIPAQIRSEKGNATLQFNHVSFRYPGAKDDVLHDINFIAKPGQTTAFIGSTGSGKSTLINLIPRFYDVTDGEILIDGVDIRKMSQHDLHEVIGYVPQKAALFSGTIESNMKLAREHATEEEMSHAARIAQATEFISAKPEGFKSEIAQAGTNVSGGQKQRLSIARAVLKKPEIYIFDDSFSALDYKTDTALRAALKPETKESTVLIVAQRVSSIMGADQIIVLDEGKIAGVGTHKELMENCSVYQEIALSQLSKEELE